MQLDYSSNIHLLIPRFMKSLWNIIIKLNTLTHTKLWWVGHLFMYVKTCERGRVKLKDFEQWSRVYNVTPYNSFSRGSLWLCYNGVAVYLVTVVTFSKIKHSKNIIRVLSKLSPSFIIIFFLLFLFLLFLHKLFVVIWSQRVVFVFHTRQWR